MIDTIYSEWTHPETGEDETLEIEFEVHSGQDGDWFTEPLPPSIEILSARNEYGEDRTNIISSNQLDIDIYEYV